MSRSHAQVEEDHKTDDQRDRFIQGNPNKRTIQPVPIRKGRQDRKDGKLGGSSSFENAVYPSSSHGQNGPNITAVKSSSPVPPSSPSMPPAPPDTLFASYQRGSNLVDLDDVTSLSSGSPFEGCTTFEKTSSSNTITTDHSQPTVPVVSANDSQQSISNNVVPTRDAPQRPLQTSASTASSFDTPISQFDTPVIASRLITPIDEGLINGAKAMDQKLSAPDEHPQVDEEQTNRANVELLMTTEQIRLQQILDPAAEEQRKKTLEQEQQEKEAGLLAQEHQKKRDEGQEKKGESQETQRKRAEGEATEVPESLKALTADVEPLQGSSSTLETSQSSSIVSPLDQPAHYPNQKDSIAIVPIASDPSTVEPIPDTRDAKQCKEDEKRRTKEKRKCDKDWAKRRKTDPFLHNLEYAGLYLPPFWFPPDLDDGYVPTYSELPTNPYSTRSILHNARPSLLWEYSSHYRRPGPAPPIPKSIVPFLQESNLTNLTDPNEIKFAQYLSPVVLSRSPITHRFYWFHPSPLEANSRFYQNYVLASPFNINIETATKTMTQTPGSSKTLQDRYNYRRHLSAYYIRYVLPQIESRSSFRGLEPIKKAIKTQTPLTQQQLHHWKTMSILSNSYAQVLSFIPNSGYEHTWPAQGEFCGIKPGSYGKHSRKKKESEGEQTWNSWQITSQVYSNSQYSTPLALCFLLQQKYPSKLMFTLQTDYRAPYIRWPDPISRDKESKQFIVTTLEAILTNLISTKNRGKSQVTLPNRQLALPISDGTLDPNLVHRMQHRDHCTLHLNDIWDLLDLQDPPTGQPDRNNTRKQIKGKIRNAKLTLVVEDGRPTPGSATNALSESSSPTEDPQQPLEIEQVNTTAAVAPKLLNWTLANIGNPKTHTHTPSQKQYSSLQSLRPIDIWSLSCWALQHCRRCNNCVRGVVSYYGPPTHLYCKTINEANIDVRHYPRDLDFDLPGQEANNDQFNHVAPNLGSDDETDHVVPVKKHILEELSDIDDDYSSSSSLTLPITASESFAASSCACDYRSSHQKLESFKQIKSLAKACSKNPRHAALAYQAACEYHQNTVDLLSSVKKARVFNLRSTSPAWSRFFSHPSLPETLIRKRSLLLPLPNYWKELRSWQYHTRRKNRQQADRLNSGVTHKRVVNYDDNFEYSNEDSNSKSELHRSRQSSGLLLQSENGLSLAVDTTIETSPSDVNTTINNTDSPLYQLDKQQRKVAKFITPRLLKSVKLRRVFKQWKKPCNWFPWLSHNQFVGFPTTASFEKKRQKRASSSNIFDEVPNLLPP